MIILFSCIHFFNGSDQWQSRSWRDGKELSEDQLTDESQDCEQARENAEWLNRCDREYEQSLGWGN